LRRVPSIAVSSKDHCQSLHTRCWTQGIETLPRSSFVSLSKYYRSTTTLQSVFGFIEPIFDCKTRAIPLSGGKGPLKIHYFLPMGNVTERSRGRYTT
jgi:hypothetical protein